MLKGRMEYTYKDMNKKNAKKHSVILGVGDIVESPPMVAHAMRFLEDSVFLALTTEKRDQSFYESDTVRIELL